MSCTRTHLRMAELGCFASTPTCRKSSVDILAGKSPPRYPLSPTRSPWRANSLRSARSCRISREHASCSSYPPIGSHGANYGAFEQLEDREAFRLKEGKGGEADGMIAVGARIIGSKTNGRVGDDCVSDGPRQHKRRCSQPIVIDCVELGCGFG